MREKYKPITKSRAEELHKPSTKQQNLPFSFLINPLDDDAVSTNSSYQALLTQENTIENANSTKSNSSFSLELSKIPSLTSIKDKNPLKNQRLSPKVQGSRKDNGLPFQRKARSISPLRESLTISKKNNHLLFPKGGPVTPIGSEEWEDGFSGIDKRERNSTKNEEDEDLEAIKARYLQMLEESYKPTDRYEEDTEEFDIGNIMKKTKVNFVFV
ncbi:unnamed protein product [Blepharisma stoltei]|uniref:Uncharacterized protein n=1 Tax=Blepharisma stoltei TaxID=1481888 RepID=A0AAU9KGD6_9CILI|nr:unnamed protein product [Blepharisma stoltei]